jgi:hypothetical protein
MKAPKLVLQVRGYTGGAPVVDLHLIQVEGATEQCLMFGQVNPARAEQLKEFFRGLGVRVRKKRSPFPGRRNV